MLAVAGGLREPGQGRDARKDFAKGFARQRSDNSPADHVPSSMQAAWTRLRSASNVRNMLQEEEVRA